MVPMVRLDSLHSHMINTITVMTEESVPWPPTPRVRNSCRVNKGRGPPRLGLSSTLPPYHPMYVLKSIINAGRFVYAIIFPKLPEGGFHPVQKGLAHLSPEGAMPRHVCTTNIVYKMSTPTTTLDTLSTAVAIILPHLPLAQP